MQSLFPSTPEIITLPRKRHQIVQNDKAYVRAMETNQVNFTMLYLCVSKVTKIEALSKIERQCYSNMHQTLLDTKFLPHC